MNDLLNETEKMLKMKILLIRHGRTAGNLEKRYVGKTDEPLLEDSRLRLQELKDAGAYPRADLVVMTEKKRSRETAEILYPDIRKIICSGLCETDFGEFEYKNYRDLSGNPDYQAFIDSGGTIPFPGGESLDAFETRCCRAFREITGSPDFRECLLSGRTAAFVIHGGSIMALLHAYGIPKKEYFSWQCKNGDGYLCTLQISPSDYKISLSAGRKLFP